MPVPQLCGRGQFAIGAYSDYLSLQPGSIMADYCPHVKRDAPKLVSAHQAADM